MRALATVCLLTASAAWAQLAQGAPTVPTRAVTVVEDHSTTWRIAAPPPASPAVNWAAKELQRYLQQMVSCKFAIVKASRGRPAVVIGLRPELLPEDRTLLPPRAQGYDGYAVAVVPATRKTPARIVIGGDNARGVIYGVYDLLERFGCRWFHPAEGAADPEVVPHRDTLSLAAGSWAVASPMKHRICNSNEWSGEMQPAPALKQLDWAMKNRYNTMGWQADTHIPLEQQYQKLADDGLLRELAQRDMLLHGPSHSFNLLLRAEDYFAAHPEWFGMRNGKRVPQTVAGAQFCWSNAEARKQFVNNVEAFARQAPQLSILCLAPPDGGQACECEPCKNAGASNLLMLLMGEVIERLHASRPDLLVETIGGYGAVTDSPEAR